MSETMAAPENPHKTGKQRDEHLNFLAAARDFHSAGADAFHPGWSQYGDLLDAAEGALAAAGRNADGESYRDLWLASTSNVARTAAKANQYRALLERLEPILREYGTWILTHDLDMRHDSPDDCLETEADAIRAALGAAS